jgi:asparagine synthase (glutamine-hydrolysing)
LLELSARIPSRWKVHGGETKWVLKQACRQRLPPAIQRRGKQGFEIPVDAWLRGPLRKRFQDTVLRTHNPLDGLIDRRVAEQLFRKHQNGLGRHGQVLWGLLVLGAWADRYLGSRSG